MLPATAKHVIETADAINWYQMETCPVTKRSIIKERAAIGYRIRNTLENRKRYGETVIEHRDNWIVVSSINAAESVARSWDKHPDRIKALVLSIKAKLKEPRRKKTYEIKPVSITMQGKLEYACNPL